jgi:rubrerythrin
MSKTTDNLKTAFAGESQANRKYLAFAEKAEKDGFPQVAKLFRAAAHAETIHAFNHFKALDGIKTTAENLKEAMGGEHYESDVMYPPMVAEAEAEGDKRALRSFTYALEVEKVHEQLYKDALEAVSQGTSEAEEFDYYVCPFCGYTHARNAPDKCPVCGAPAEKFERIA